MTHKVGLIGWPVSHSLSPAMHNAAFAALGLDWRYDLLPIEPGNVAPAIAHLLAGGYRGLNVTMPYKQMVLSLPAITEIDPAVTAIGAANTLIRLDNGNLRAANTDWRGFTDDLSAHGVNLNGVTALILGTGGSAQAVAYALRQRGGMTITYVSRSPDAREDTISYQAVAAYAGGRDDLLIVNCTPVGMWPAVEQSPWPDGVPFPPGSVLYDLIYNPAQTRLMGQARTAGARVIGGLGMLIRQGAAAFTLWTGIEPPYDVMEQAAQQLLSG